MDNGESFVRDINRFFDLSRETNQYIFGEYFKALKEREKDKKIIAEISLENYGNQVRITNYMLEKNITEQKIKDLEERLRIVEEKNKDFVEREETLFLTIEEMKIVIKSLCEKKNELIEINKTLLKKLEDKDDVLVVD